MPRNNPETGGQDVSFDRERRQHPRHQVTDLPIQLDGQAPLRVRDLSRSGACFFSETPLRMMTHLRFSFDLPQPGGGTARAEGEGVVVRCERLSPALGHYEIALFFQELDQDAERVIRDYLAGQAG